MKLHWSPRSPFVRIVMIVAHETGQTDSLTLVRTVVSRLKPNPALLTDSPVCRLPTAVLDDGTVLGGSYHICEYLDAQHAGTKLIPASGPARWAQLEIHGVADGLLDTLIAWRGERDRATGSRSSALLAAFALKTQSCLDWLEARAEKLGALPYGIGQITAGCALEYADFRFADLAWRESRPALAKWCEQFASRPSSKATAVVDDAAAAAPAASARPAKHGPLAGIRVLDLSRVMAGPWATQILADLGADVIKVERPDVGDDTRSWGPPFIEDPRTGTRGDSGYFLCVNRGKRSVTVDLAKPAGQELVRNLAKSCDILIENYKVGTLERFNLGYKDLKAVKPDLIYASVSGFGQSGPRASQAAYDFMIQAMGGLMSVTGEADGKPGGGPQKVGVPVVDLMTGMYAAVAILAALARRERTGGGEFVDVAMLDVQLAFLANQAMNYLISGKAPRRNGNSHPNIQPQNVYACGDGHLAVAVGNDGQFAKFSEVLGMAELASDERFAQNASRVRNLAELNALILDALKHGDAKTWIAKFDAVGVPCGPINSIPDVLEDPQVKYRGMLQSLPHPLAGNLPQVISPMKFHEAPLQFDRAAPLLGEHTDEVLRELGIDAATLEKLKNEHVI